MLLSGVLSLVTEVLPVAVAVISWCLTLFVTNSGGSSSAWLLGVLSPQGHPQCCTAHVQSSEHSGASLTGVDQADRE